MSYFGIPVRNGLPIGLGTVAPLGINTFSPFSPASFFANGEQGWWYDPSNFATLFEDAAGTIPVTAVEQPVGLQLDLSQGLALGPELVTNGDFSNGTTGYTAANGAAISVVSGVLQVTQVSAGNPQARQSISGLVVGRSYLLTCLAANNGAVNAALQIGSSFAVTSSTSLVPLQVIFTATATSQNIELQASGSSGAAKFDNISLKSLAGNHRFQTQSANRPKLAALVNLFVGTATLATQSVTTRATTHTLTFTGAGSITLTGTAIGVYTAGTYSVTTTAGTLTATVLGTVNQADLRETNVGVGLPAYQAVVTSTNYDSTGFPVYIKPNGSNQFMQTNSIDFTATDKMTVWQGVRGLVNTTGVLAELSIEAGTNNGAFALYAAFPSNAYTFRSRGTVLADASSSNVYPPPLTNVLTGIGDISGDRATLRINGAQVVQITTNQGTGNYGNYPAYFYARAGTSLFFNGNDYGSIARGAASTAAQITNGETYINSLTKAYT